jgi:immune inhibitor A
VAPDRIRVVFVLAQFVDLAMGRPREYFTDAERRAGLVERLVDYYSEVSHGHLLVEPTVAEGIVTVAQPRARYRQKPAALVRDATSALLATPAERAAHAALERADAVIVFFAGPGEESDLRGGARDPWSNFTALVPPVVTPGGRRLGKGCVIAASEREGLSSFGVLCHEFGHLLGLPELYAPGGAPHEGIGVWGLMGQGTWLGRGDRPPHPSAWCKVAMGWANVEIIGTSGRVTLPAVDHSGRVVKLWASGPEQPWAYVLIENRQRRGTDGRLPGSGLLVWRIDERVGGFRTSQSDPDRLRVRLIQADGRDDLRSGHRGGGNRGDATDPWGGMGWGARRCLDAAVLIGLGLVALGGLRRARRGGADARAGVLVITGLLLGVIGVGVPRSPTLRSEDILAGLDLGSGAARFTISDISPPGDPMTFTVRIEDGGTPH